MNKDGLPIVHTPGEAKSKAMDLLTNPQSFVLEGSLPDDPSSEYLFLHHENAKLPIPEFESLNFN